MNVSNLGLPLKDEASLNYTFLFLFNGHESVYDHGRRAFIDRSKGF